MTPRVWARVEPDAVPAELSSAVAAALLDAAPMPWPELTYVALETEERDGHFERGTTESWSHLSTAVEVQVLTGDGLLVVNVGLLPAVAAELVAEKFNPKEAGDAR